MLAAELRAIGLADAALDENGYLMATIPATVDRDGRRSIGFIAHVDTSPEMPGAGVRPIVHRAWDGRDIVLPDDPSAVLRAADIPDSPRRSGTTSSPRRARRCSARTTRPASRRSWPRPNT